MRAFKSCSAVKVIGIIVDVVKVCISNTQTLWLTCILFCIFDPFLNTSASGRLWNIRFSKMKHLTIWSLCLNSNHYLSFNLTLKIVKVETMMKWSKIKPVVERVHLYKMPLICEIHCSNLKQFIVAIWNNWVTLVKQEFVKHKCPPKSRYFFSNVCQRWPRLNL